MDSFQGFQKSYDEISTFLSDERLAYNVPLAAMNLKTRQGEQIKIFGLFVEIKAGSATWNFRRHNNYFGHFIRKIFTDKA